MRKSCCITNRSPQNDQFAEKTSWPIWGRGFKKAISEITDAIADLGQFPEKGIDISKMYGIETAYYYLFFKHNDIIYRFDEKTVTVLQMFDEKEDYMNTLFGISGRTQESIDYWGE